MFRQRRRRCAVHGPCGRGFTGHSVKRNDCETSLHACIDRIRSNHITRYPTRLRIQVYLSEVPAHVACPSFRGRRPLATPQVLPLLDYHLGKLLQQHNYILTFFLQKQGAGLDPSPRLPTSSGYRDSFSNYLYKRQLIQKLSTPYAPELYLPSILFTLYTAGAVKKYMAFLQCIYYTELPSHRCNPS